MITWKPSGIPYGYTYNRDTGKLQEHPEESKILQLIFDLAAKGEKISNITEQLNTRGMKPRRGNLWINVNLGFLLYPPRLEFYTGYQNKEKGNWPALLKEDIYKKILSFKSDAYGKKKAEKTEYLLSGLGIFYCGYCGSLIKITSSKTKDTKIDYYGCSRRLISGSNLCPSSKLIRQDVVDPLVLNDVKIHLPIMKELFPAYKKYILKHNKNIINKLLSQANENNIEDIQGKIKALTNQLSIEFPFNSPGKTNKEKISNALEKILLYNDRIELIYKTAINKKFETKVEFKFEKKR